MSAELLAQIAEVTRTVFAAQACSIMAHDEATRELVFEAVAGRGSDTLIGQRIPATTGLAGWALAAEEPIAVADVVSDPRFARDVAESTGYVPTAITVYPLLADERSLGVLSVLDQGTGRVVGLADMEVLGKLAAHAAALLALTQTARAAQREHPDDPLASLRRALAGADPVRREAALAAISALHRLLVGR
jgi:GAF domain-containing protein